MFVKESSFQMHSAHIVDVMSGAPTGEDGKHTRPVIHRFILHPILCEERSKLTIPLFMGRFRFQFDPWNTSAMVGSCFSVPASQLRRTVIFVFAELFASRRSAGWTYLLPEQQPHHDCSYLSEYDKDQETSVLRERRKTHYNDQWWSKIISHNPENTYLGD